MPPTQLAPQGILVSTVQFEFMLHARSPSPLVLVAVVNINFSVKRSSYQVYAQ